MAPFLGALTHTLFALTTGVQIIPISFLAYRNLILPSKSYVETDHAIYEGLKSDSGVGTTFYGIPYALPPVGERRFRAPVPLDGEGEKAKNGGKKKVVKALQKPNFCVQGPTSAGTASSIKL
jgi:hypothetical protein